MTQQDNQVRNGLLELAKSGCQGNLHDYKVWLNSLFSITLTDQELSNQINDLIKEKILCPHSSIQSEYILSTQPDFKQSINYHIPSNLEFSPIQWVRSRLESFLNYHKVRKSDMIDLSIATTEAMENAVKYSNEKEIFVTYRLVDDQFTITIENEIKDVTPEQDIESGKYTGSLTLMRGMMVMVKLLDKVDIDIVDAENKAVFTATHQLGKVG